MSNGPGGDGGFGDPEADPGDPPYASPEPVAGAFILRRVCEDGISGAAGHEAEQRKLPEQVGIRREAEETFEQDQSPF